MADAISPEGVGNRVVYYLWASTLASPSRDSHAHEPQVPDDIHRRGWLLLNCAHQLALYRKPSIGTQSRAYLSECASKYV